MIPVYAIMFHSSIIVGMQKSDSDGSLISGLATNPAPAVPVRQATNPVGIEGASTRTTGMSTAEALEQERIRRIAEAKKKDELEQTRGRKDSMDSRDGQPGCCGGKAKPKK